MSASRKRTRTKATNPTTPTHIAVLMKPEQDLAKATKLAKTLTKACAERLINTLIEQHVPRVNDPPTPADEDDVFLNILCCLCRKFAFDPVVVCETCHPDSLLCGHCADMRHKRLVDIHDEFSCDWCAREDKEDED